MLPSSTAVLKFVLVFLLHLRMRVTLCFPSRNGYGGTQRGPSAPAGVGTRQESRPQEESGVRSDITFGRCGHEGGVYGKNLGIRTQYYPTHSILLPRDLDILV